MQLRGTQLYYRIWLLKIPLPTEKPAWQLFDDYSLGQGCFNAAKENRYSEEIAAIVQAIGTSKSVIWSVKILLWSNGVRPSYAA